MDQETELIVKDFTGILAELTFNSKPIITTLTKIAEENISCAQYFVDALEARISKCVPSQKLFSFYALDSICKNAGSPYTIYFSKDLFNLYKKTYLLVDNATRRKLVSLFKTWLTPSETTGTPLFDTSVLGKIQNFLVKASALHQRNVQTLLPAPTVPQLLNDIDSLTKLTEQRLNLAPNDEKLTIKLQVLSQLKQELQREKLPQSALRQVQLQLKNIFAQEQQNIQQQLRFRQETPTLPNPEVAVASQSSRQAPGNDAQPQGSSARTSKNLGSNSPSSPLFENLSSSEKPGGTGNSALPPLLQASQGMTSSLFGTVPNSFFSRDLEEADKKSKTLAQLEPLYNSLDELGLLYKPPKESIVTLYTKLASKTRKLNDPQDNSASSQAALPDISTLQNILFDCKAYFATKDINLALVSSLQFDSRHLNAENSMVDNNLVHVLYRLKSNKCSACGKRFGNSPEERLLQANHMDWHFRINRRIKGTTETISVTGSTATQKNIQSRNWYLSDLAWIEFKDEDIISTKKVSDTENNVENSSKIARDSRSGSTQPAGTINRDSVKPETSSLTGTTTPRRDVITVPESSEDMSYRCPICQDRTTAVYDDELGEWVWRNTVEVNGKFFHASCYRETARNGLNGLGDIVSI